MSVGYVRQLGQGTHLLTRFGQLIKTDLHVPSTKFMEAGIRHLSPTDGQFLLDYGKIDFDDLVSIVLFNLIEFMPTGKVLEHSDYTRFKSFAELKWAPDASDALNEIGVVPNMSDLYDMQEDYPDFMTIDAKYYTMLCNDFCKVSRFNNSLEFRITSEDNFDWNKVIIDGCLLPHESEIKNCRINILKEINGGDCKAYFLDASLNDILEHDKAILSDEKLHRIQSGNKIEYFTVE